MELLQTDGVKHDRNHIVSAGYIRNWAVGDVVECELVPDGMRKPLSPNMVGVRTKFFAGSPAPDGSRTAAEAEQARNVVETRALPLLRDLADRWPLRNAGERAWVAMWLAMTLCASPHSRRQIPDTVARFFADFERDEPTLAALTVRKRNELSEPDFELDSMFDEVSTVASVLGHMHWTLLRFGRPVLISSDHPIVSHPWRSNSTPSAHGALETLLGDYEVRVAVGPRTGMLLTWVDADDRVEARRGAKHHVDVFNNGAWRQAERHRFWQPGTEPRGVGDGLGSAPIATELFRDYSIRDSLRLGAALEWSRERLVEQYGGVDDRAVVTAWVERDGERAVVVPVRNDGEHAEAFSEFAL